MLKLMAFVRIAKSEAQPPSGGCVLKQFVPLRHCLYSAQPPSGGCVLKPNTPGCLSSGIAQPPSGGCVLKHLSQQFGYILFVPAAFGRLCVETSVS